MEAKILELLAHSIYPNGYKDIRNKILSETIVPVKILWILENYFLAQIDRNLLQAWFSKLIIMKNSDYLNLHQYTFKGWIVWIQIRK